MKIKFSTKLMLVIILCQLGSSLLAFLVVFILFACGVEFDRLSPILPIAFVLFSSVIISLIATSFRTRKMALGVDEINAGLTRIGEGDFSKPARAEKTDKPFDEIIVTLNKVMRELDSTAILKRDFINNFSHEFKTPIASIQGFAEILIENPDLSEEEKRKYYAIIEEESRRLANISDMTLLLGKLDSQSLDLKKEDIYLDAEVEECALQFYKQVEEKKIKVEIDVDHVPIHASKALSKELWLNLLSNAIKYSYEGGKVEVYSYENEKDICLCVKDNGIGMDEETKEKIFDEYYQADKSRINKGIGLGLSICKRIADLHGYRIEVSSKEGEGSVFTVIIPK